MNYPKPIKKIVHGSRYFLLKQIFPQHILVDWSKRLNNFGDILNPHIIEYFSSKKIINVRSDYCQSEHMLAIGSVLDRANKNSIVWGSGYISENSRFVENPKQILAVRGPKTRQLLLKQNVECPEVYGDPALLLPKIYHQHKKTKYLLGVIPHYIDKKNQWLINQQESVKIIDIQNPNPYEVVDQILECNNIISSSLHGLIVADAYKIPSLWVQFSTKITGGSFKFQDYYKSINNDTISPYYVKETTTLDEVLIKCKSHPVDLNLQPLIDAFPYSYK